MKEIASRLGAEGWPLIDATLKQFSLPWSNEWNGSADAYVLHMVAEASDQSLIDLARHVGFQFEEVSASPIDPSFWRKGMLRLFVSHLAEHCKFAAELQEALLALGISCFIAHNDIEPTRDWQTQIEMALATCDALVALLHQGFHASSWTDQELGFAMGRGVPVFAVRFGEDPYGFIGRFQAFNGNRKPPATLAHELFDAYINNTQTRHRMSEAVVELFEESSSFAEAKVRMDYLEGLELWEPSFSKRIRLAATTNSQIRESWHVPDRVSALIGKWKKRGV